jgi:hypothetical protein
VTDRRLESENTSTKRWSKECRGRAGEKRVIEREWKSPSSININAKRNKKRNETKRVWRGRVVSDPGSERLWPIHVLIKKG